MVPSSHHLGTWLGRCRLKYLSLLVLMLFLVGCATAPMPIPPDPTPTPIPAPPPDDPPKDDTADPGMGYPPGPSGKCSSKATAGKMFGKCYTIEAAEWNCQHKSFWLYSQECAVHGGGKDH